MYEYISCDWKHNFEQEPVTILYEVDLDEERYATRMIEVFADGHINNLQDKEWKFITEEPIPSVDDINKGEFGEEFSVCMISKEEFENIWTKNTE